MEYVNIQDAIQKTKGEVHFVYKLDTGKKVIKYCTQDYLVNDQPGKYIRFHHISNGMVITYPYTSLFSITKSWYERL